MKNKLLFTVLLFALLLIFAFPFQAFAQNDVTILNANGEAVFSFTLNSPDPAMRRVPGSITTLRQRDAPEFFRQLAEYITENSTCDFDRVKKAHDWVALNIRYDAQSYFSRQIPAQDANAVLRRGLAVCAGYAQLFKALLDTLEVENRIVHGYARGAGVRLFRSEDPMNTNHAWNIVTISGKQYLIDSTWNSGHLNGRNFVAEYRTAYLFIDPAILIFSHFPSDNRDQLLYPPISAETFVNLPFLEPDFFRTIQTYPELKKITELAVGEELTLEFSTIEGYNLAYVWYTDADVIVGRAVFPGKRDVYSITVQHNRPGRFILRIGTLRPGLRTVTYNGYFGFNVR